MAARNIPMPEITRTIIIDSTFTPNHQGMIVQPNDTVNFQNNSGVDIIIEFQSNAPNPDVYPPMNLAVANGTTSGFTAPSTSTAGNYYVYQGATQKSGPWVVQVGSGVMYVTLASSGGGVTYTPQTVAIPLGTTSSRGNLNISPSGFTLRWDTTDPFNPPLTSSGGGSTVGNSAGAGDYSYSASASAARMVPAVGGGGKVIIRGT